MSHFAKRTVFVLSLLFGLCAPARAQPAPAAEPITGDIRFIVPVEPGGGIDAIARMVAQQWTAEQQTPVVVINRAGASGNIGTASVARAPADGRTLLVTAVAHLTSPMLHTQAGYDPHGDFVPVARFGTAPNVIMVSEALKGMSLRQVLQDARSSDGRLAFGSAGFGHSSHLAAEFFMARTGARWLHVPFKGNAPAVRALLGGEVQLLFLSVPSVPAAIASGKAFPLAVAHRERLAILPDTPTLEELGVRDAEFLQWYGLFAPRGTPAATVRQLSAMAVKAVQSPSVVQQLRSHGAEPAPLNDEQFARFVAAEQRRLEAVLRNTAVQRPVN